MAPPPEPTVASAKARPGSRERPLSPAQVVRGTNGLLDREIGTLWVEGEVDSLIKASSGHLYFAIKDPRAQLRAVMWRSDASRLRFAIENGQCLRCRGRFSIYERDGKFQMYVQAVEPAGAGAEALAFEQLKAKLAGEGLFDADRKRPLPRLPHRIGVVTSKSGAAVRDIIRAVERRFPVPMLIADARVQGSGSPAAIARAIAMLCKTDVDVIIVGRGGGSSVDLSAFNDEQVVRAVASCPVPVISAVGHEVDISLTDLAADVRAATPTMAGEMAVPVRADMADLLAKVERRLVREIEHRLHTAKQELDHLEARGRHRVSDTISLGHRKLGHIERALEALHPRSRLAAHRSTLAEQQSRAQACIRQALDQRSRVFASLTGRLQALSPLKVLERGYAIAQRDGAVLASAEQVDEGDAISVRLRRGQLSCVVQAVHRDPTEDSGS